MTILDPYRGDNCLQGEGEEEGRPPPLADEDDDDEAPSAPPTKKFPLSGDKADIFVEKLRNNTVMIESRHEQYKQPNLVQMLWADICHTLYKMEEHLLGWYKTKRDRLVKLNRLKKSTI